MYPLPRLAGALTDARVAPVLTAPHPAFVLTPDGRLLLCNPAALALLGASSIDEAAGVLALERGPLAAALRALRQRAPDAPPDALVIPFRVRGARRVIEFTGSRLAESDSVLLRALVPETARGYEPTAAAAALFEGERDALALLDADGRVMHANRAAAGLLGATTRLPDLIAGGRAALAQALADGESEVAFGVLRVFLRRLGGRDARTMLAAFVAPERPAVAARPTEPVPGAASVAAIAATPAREATAAADAAPQGSNAGVSSAPEPVVTPPTAASDAPAPEAEMRTPAQEATPAVPPTAPATDPAPGGMNARAPARFVWQTDAEGRFARVSPELPAAVGAKNANLQGLTWRDAAARIGIEGVSAVADAMARRDTWSGITVRWPEDDASARLVELAALPVFDRERRFLGYRGFGVFRETVARARTSAAPTPPDPSERLPADRAAATAPEVPALAAPENVVPLHKGPVTAESRQGADRGRGQSLTAGERTAFREIAKVIGARLRRADGDNPPATAANDPTPARVQGGGGPAVAAPAATAAPAPAISGERAVLDRLPLGVAVHRGERVLFANRTLLDWIGIADTAGLAAAGGLVRIFAGAPDLRADSEQSPRTVTVASGNGEAIPVEARLLSAPWEGEPALVYVLRRQPAGENERLEASERALREAEAAARELRAILDTATDGIALLDRDGNVLGMNRSAEALFGFDAAEIEGRSFSVLFAPESHRAALDYLNGLAESGVASVLNDGREVIGRVREGGLIPLFMTLGRVGEHGKNFCAVFRDITQWKRAEEELVKAKRDAERASSAKSEFLAKISHEIRTPLNAILGFSQVMMEERFGPIGNDRYREYLKDIHASGEHLISLINDLLDLSKIEAGKLELSFASVDLNEIASQCMALMQPQANRERIIIRTALAAKLPPVVADARSIRQIVLNLLSNSIKFTRPGGQVIVSTMLAEDGEVHLRVRDTGIGMSEVELKTALEPFRQIATSGRAKADGTGLGLPLTKALVEANRARFAIKSTVNAGTLVEIVFPSTRVLAE